MQGSRVNPQEPLHLGSPRALVLEFLWIFPETVYPYVFTLHIICLLKENTQWPDFTVS